MKIIYAVYSVQKDQTIIKTSAHRCHFISYMYIVEVDMAYIIIYLYDYLTEPLYTFNNIDGDWIKCFVLYWA